MAFDKYSYINQHKRDNYTRLSILVPKQKGELINNFAKQQGKSVNQLFISAVEAQYGIDLSKPEK